MKRFAYFAAAFFAAFPSSAHATPYCTCEVTCVYDDGGLCLIGGGSTMATVRWSGTFDYHVGNGDPFGGTLKAPQDFKDDCTNSAGFAQRGLYSKFNSLCRSKVGWGAYLNALGRAHEVTLRSCSYSTKR